MTCQHCGTPAVRADQRFCARCGADLKPPAAVTLPAPAGPAGPAGPATGQPTAPTAAVPPAPGERPAAATVVPPPPPPAQPAAAPATAPAHRRGRNLVVLAVLAVLAAVIGAGGTLLALRGDGRATADDRTGGSAERGGTTPQATENDGATDAGADDTAQPGTTAASPTDAPEPTRFQCWNGGVVTGPAACDRPTGLDGLHWVFPQSAVHACSAGDAHGREVLLNCTTTAPSGATVVVNYTEWRSRKAAEFYYTGLDVTGTLSRPGVDGWYIAARSPNPPYKAALLYEDVPFSVTIYGDTAADRDAVLRAMTTRPKAELRGTRLP